VKAAKKQSQNKANQSQYSRSAFIVRRTAADGRQFISVQRSAFCGLRQDEEKNFKKQSQF
jgi:hypothetical protein